MTLAPWKKSYDQPRQHIKEQRHYSANKGQSSQSYGFSSGHAWMWELDCEEGWPLKNWCFWSVVLEKTLESPLEIDPTSPFCRRWVLRILWKEWCWSWNSSTLATSSRVDSLEKTLMLGGIGGRRKRGRQRMRLLDGVTDSMNLSE